jgi:hypothetical protein
MFRENDKHLQLGLFDTVQQLPEEVRRRLKASWADPGEEWRGVECP